MASDGIRTIMVKAAPRLATILCLLFVRRNAMGVDVGDGPLVGQLRCKLVKGHEAREERVHTLAMPIGDADSAMLWTGLGVGSMCCLRDG